jgi:uncharacterized protein
MHMESILIDLDPSLEQTGGYALLSGTLDWTSYDVGGLDYDVVTPLNYNLTLSNTGDMLVLHGKLTGRVNGTCARCLKPASFQVDGEVEEFYLANDVDPEEFDLAEDEFERIPENGQLDATPALYAALVYETPQMLLCKPDCKGLCPHCGADLNEGDCGCQLDDDIDETNPFAVLKGMFDDQPEEGAGSSQDEG